MDAAGYETSYVGKTLNDYNGATASPPAPPGYDRWFGWLLQDPSTQTRHQCTSTTRSTRTPTAPPGRRPGSEVLYGNDDEDYLTDVLRDRALDQTRRARRAATTRGS